MLQDTSNLAGTHGVRQTLKECGSDPEPRRQSPAPSPQDTAARVLLSDSEAARSVFGISLRKFHQLEHEPWFPRPILLGRRCKRHVRSELEAAVANMPRREKPAPEPAQLLRGRIERAKASGVLG